MKSIYSRKGIGVVFLILLQYGSAQNVTKTVTPEVINYEKVLQIINGTNTKITSAPTSTPALLKATSPSTTITPSSTSNKPSTLALSTASSTSQASSSISVSSTTITQSSSTVVTSTASKVSQSSETTPATISTAKVSSTAKPLLETVAEVVVEAATTSSLIETETTVKSVAPEQLNNSTEKVNTTTENPAAPESLISNVYGLVQAALKESPTSPSTPQTTTETVPTTTTKRPEALGPGPVVKIAQGDVQPLVWRSRKGRKYYAFKGIPYAIPPVHYLRFKDTEIIAPWSGVRNASEYGPACIQYDILTEQVTGEEDCLHLNIFTPKLPSGRNKKKADRFPVMVFFHQGAFMFGNSRDFEEAYMMDENIVLVTVNYRLNAFGFLNTEGDSDAKGNQGLKDQVLALKFIRENIHHFNGEADLVTIFGESAGASSVHYHLLSERSRGLFQRAISMSGTALSPWAFTRSPRKMAKKLGTFLNCPTLDMNEMFSCLQGHDAKIIAGKMKDLYEWNTDPITPFAPSIEVEESQLSFLTQSPYQLMKSGQILDVPFILGVVEDVCLLDAYSILVNPELTNDLNVDWHRIAPITFMYRETAAEPDAVSNQIRAYYFSTKAIGNDTASNLTNLYSDRYFNHGIRTTALMHARANEARRVYLYMFSYKGSQSHTKFADISDIIGVSEGDDLRYLFNTDRFDDIPINSKDGEISQKFIKLWASFARDGKPTAVWGDQEWKHITAEQVIGDEALMYYSLNDQCGFIEEPFSGRLNFWDSLPLEENANELFSPLNQKNHGDDDIFDRYN